MNKAFTDWYNSLPNGEPSYQETFEAGYAAASTEAELPVLPEPDVYAYDINTAMHVLTAHSTDQLQAYGAACAAHARELVLSEAKDIAHKCCHAEASLFGDGYNTAAFNIEREIEALKKEGKV